MLAVRQGVVQPSYGHPVSCVDWAAVSCTILHSTIHARREGEQHIHSFILWWLVPLPGKVGTCSGKGN